MTETQSKQMLSENGTDRLAPHKAATKLQAIKHTVSTKWNKAKYDKTKYAHTIREKTYQKYYESLVFW